MTSIEALEHRLEKSHRHFIYRVLLTFFILFTIAYVNVWLHEFMHFIYAVVILHDSNASIVYDHSGIFLTGYCQVSKADIGLYYVGGIGSSVVLLGVWLVLLSIPHRYTTPIEVHVFSFGLMQFVYGLCEGTMLVFTHPYVAMFISYMAFCIGYWMYKHRLWCYLRGDV